MLLDWIEEAINAAYRQLAARVGQHLPRLVEPMIDAAALVAAADGTAGDRASRREQAEAMNAARQIANLGRLGLNRAAQRFEGLKADLSRHPERRGAVLARLRAVRPPPQEAQLILHVAGAVAAVDGHVSAPERAMLDAIADALGLEPPSAA